jgi:hypothetical protein
MQFNDTMPGFSLHFLYHRQRNRSCANRLTATFPRTRDACNRSAARLAMAPVPEDLFLDALRELVRLDPAWIPAVDVGALYIRPLQFSDDPSIRVKSAERYQFIILTFPFGAYYTAPVDVLVCERYVRAFPGGTWTQSPPGTMLPVCWRTRKPMTQDTVR